MKKIKSNIIKNIMIFLGIMIAVSSVVLTRWLGDLDEIWNFNFARNMANNLVPYRDFNMVQMPLLPIIVSSFLRIFGNKLIVTRVLAVLLGSAILFMTYQILSVLKVHSYVKIVSTLFLFLVLADYICLDYNFAILLVLLCIMYLELKRSRRKKKIDHEKKYDFLIGVLAGICFCFKQSTGAIILIITIAYSALQIRKKEDWKTFFKIAVYRSLGAMIPICAIMIYILANSAWNDFIDYCVLGISTFTNKIPYWSLLRRGNLAIKTLAILFPLTVIFMLFVTGITKNKKMTIMTAYSVAGMPVMFPITDNIHFLIGYIPFWIAFVYILHVLIRRLKYGYKDKKWMRYTRDFLKCTIVLTTFILLVIATKENIEYLQKANQYKDFEEYNYIRTNTSLVSKIKNVDEYIENSEKNVYILDAEAAIYRIPTKTYYKDYDMFLEGNLGSKGEQGQIEKLRQDQNKIILIKNDNVVRNWQNPELVREEIKINYTKIGEIEYFDIYE